MTTTHRFKLADVREFHLSGLIHPDLAHAEGVAKAVALFDALVGSFTNPTRIEAMAQYGQLGLPAYALGWLYRVERVGPELWGECRFVGDGSVPLHVAARGLTIAFALATKCPRTGSAQPPRILYAFPAILGRDPLLYPEASPDAPAVDCGEETRGAEVVALAGGSVMFETPTLTNARRVNGGFVGQLKPGVIPPLPFLTVEREPPAPTSGFLTASIGHETLVLSAPDDTELLRLEAAGDLDGAPVLAAFVGHTRTGSPSAVADVLIAWTKAWRRDPKNREAHALIAAIRRMTAGLHPRGQTPVDYLAPEPYELHDLADAASVYFCQDLRADTAERLTQAEVDAVLHDPAMRPRGAS